MQSPLSPISSVETNINALVAALGFQLTGETFFGTVRNYPVGIQFIGFDESMVVLIQFRYVNEAERNKVTGLSYSAEVEGFIANKQIEISLENKIGWVTINGDSLLKSGSIQRILESVAGTFEKAGVESAPGKCHYCLAEEVPMPICTDGKVARICSKCLENRVNAQASVLRPTVRGLSKVSLLAPIAAMAGAICWAAIWWGSDYVFSYLDERVIILPRMVETIVFLCVGFLVGGPVGFILKKIPNRGDTLGGALGVIFGIASVLMGEILYVVGLIFQRFHVISFSGAVKILPRLWMETMGFYLVYKLLAAIVSVAVAAAMARPEKKRMAL